MLFVRHPSTPPRVKGFERRTHLADGPQARTLYVPPRDASRDDAMLVVR